MKKRMNKRGFTLIEIMIVIVIISLLAVALVPRLTGAQARSRDTSRAAGLVGMKAVLVTYFGDYSVYPNNTHGSTASSDGNYCLSDASGSTISLKDYVESGKMPVDPQKTVKNGACDTPGSYGYVSLQKDGNASTAYLLSAQTETYQKSNTLYTDGGTALAKNGTNEILNMVGGGKRFDNTKTITELKSKTASDVIFTVVGG